MGSPTNYNQVVIDTFRANGGRVPGRDSLLLLTTTGAKTGQPRTSPLAYSKDGDRVVVLASKQGMPTNPDWYHNLMANPVVTVELGGERFQARAIVAEGAERERLFAEHVRQLPGFGEYQHKTTRQIPVITLERI
jgi:deazaflavin-dependent oxidoreductase (nitroreductase family)